LAVEAWDDAAHTLEQFRADHPEHPLQVKATQKLAYAYERSGHGLSAAGEYLKLGNDRQSESAVRREALRRSAALYRQVGEKREAIEILELYLTHFPKPVDDSIDVMQQLADLESASGNIARRRHWLNNIVAWDGKGGDASTQVVAAQAALELAEERLQAFRRIRLVEPLKKTLADKLREMKQALKAYETAIGYGVEPVTTAARYNIASMYDELSQELRVSKRPSNLDAEALAHYELLLEEQAAPFEQRAIEIYTSNVRQRNAQETDPWVQKSRQRLEALQPDRLTGLKPKVEAEDTR
jgi:tetratricopeptide (TPR) repeat protein